MNVRNVNKNKIVPHVLTYPRSGMHFFDDTLYEIEGIHFSRSHFLDELFDKNNNKQRVIITIARDPIDSISSYLAIHHGVADIFLTIQRITDYVLMYAFLCENADYVIDFNDLVTYPEPVVKKILSLLNIDKNEYSLFNRGHISKFKNYVPSSKSLKNYDNSLLDNLDTDLCYFYYNKLLEKKIIL
jgi:hypothetical protein